jgi:tetratricopeptide (TPR) repeat protein
MAEKKKKRRLWLWIPLGIIVFIVIIGIAFSGSGSSNSTAEPVSQKDGSANAAPKDELSYIIVKANKAYDSEDYQTASEYFGEAIDSGSSDGIVWYRYAYALNQTGEISIKAYKKAYELLSTQNSEHKYTAYAASALFEHAPSFDYRKGMLEDYSTGTIFRITGEVFQLFQEEYALVHTKKEEYIGYTDDLVLITFNGKPRLLEGDIITISAEYRGTTTYETTLGSEKKVPQFGVIAYRIEEE